jgi:hypothetical protein
MSQKKKQNGIYSENENGIYWSSDDGMSWGFYPNVNDIHNQEVNQKYLELKELEKKGEIVVDKMSKEAERELMVDSSMTPVKRVDILKKKTASVKRSVL